MNNSNLLLLNDSENKIEQQPLAKDKENNQEPLLLEQPRSAKRKSQEAHGVEKRANLNFFNPVKRLTHKEYHEMALKAKRLRRPNASPKVQVPDVEEKIPSPVKTPPESPLSTTPLKQLFLENSSDPARNSQLTLSQQTQFAGKRKREF